MGKMKDYFKLDIADKRYKSILLLSYSLIALIAVGIVTTSLFSWLNSYTEKTISKMSLAQLNNLSNIMDRDLETYRMQLQTAWQEPNIRKHVYTDTENWETEYQIGLYLQKMCVSNGVADYVCLFRDTEEFQYYGPRYPDQEERQQLEAAIMETQNDMEYFLVETPGKRSLYLFLTERRSLGESPQRGIIYSLDLADIERQLVADDVEDSFFLVYGKEGHPILRSGFEEAVLSRIWELACQREGTDRDSKLVLDGSRYLHTSIYNENADMYFVLLQAFQISQRQLSEIRNVIFIAVAASFIIVLILAFILTKRLYIPLEVFFSRLFAEQEFLPADESYSRQKIEITSERILSQIHIMSQQYHSDKVLRYLDGVDPEADIPPVLRLTDREEHCIMILFWCSQAAAVKKLRSDICSGLEENSAGCKLYSFEDSQAPWFLILVKEQERLGMLTDRASFQESVKRAVEGTGKEGIYCALSSLIVSEKELQEQFRLLQTAFKYHLLGESRICMDAPMLENRLTTEVPARIYDELLALVRKGDCDGAASLLPSILDYLAAYEITKALLSLADLCVQIAQCVYGLEWAGRVQQENYLNHYVKITSLYDRSDLEQYLEQFIREICLERNVLQEKTIRMNMLDASGYIQEHYRDPDISVEQVAEKFHISVSYFSKLFNESTGMTFPEFINDLRLTYAQELLRSNSDISVKKVAEICGFSTTSYFSARFKKKFSVSPSSVRNSR